MTIRELLAWQWSDYSAKHRNAVNLAIHIVAVPLFMLGCAGVVLGILRLGAARITFGLGVMVVAVMLEGVGHRLEAEQPTPFAGFPDFLRRFFLEQWVTFPRFVLSGRYLQNLLGRSAR